MFAKIYRPRPSAMTSGRAKTNHWVVEFASTTPRIIDPLTGNAVSTDTREQVDLKFDTLEEAVAYCQANDIPHLVQKTQATKRIPRSYADNFAFDRKLPWTH
jgi:hypothetical protein